MSRSHSLLAALAWALLPAVVACVALGGPEPARAEAGGVLGGRVVDAAGAPLAGVCVELVDAATGLSPARVATDAHGGFAIPVAPGAYDVLFESCPQGPPVDVVSQWYPGRPDEAAARPVTVGDGADVILTAQMSTGGRIAGRLVDADTGAPPAGARLRLFTPGTRQAEPRPDPEAQAVVTPDGRFTFSGLAGGGYLLEVAPHGPYGTAWYPDVPDPGRARAIVVRTGATTTLATPVRADRGGTIAGVIHGSAAAPDDVVVAAWVREPDGSRYTSGETTPSTGGRYALSGLTPGRWRVSAERRLPGLGGWLPPGGATRPPVTAGVTVRERMTTSLDLTLRGALAVPRARHHGLGDAGR